MKQNVVLLVLGIVVAVVLIGGGAALVLDPELLDDDVVSNTDSLPIPNRENISERDENASEGLLTAEGKEILIDESGRRYFVGPDGKRIYIDEHGRYYRLRRNGKRIFVGPDGQPVPVGADGLPLTEKEALGVGPTDAGTDNDKTEPADEAEPKFGQLTGRVVDDLGGSFECASVKAVSKGTVSKTTKTDEEGMFTFTKLPAGQTIEVFASDSDGQTSRKLKTRLKEGTTKLPEDLVLPRLRDISGYVVSSTDGTPLSGVLVQLQAGAGRSFKDVATILTDSGGSFRFEKPELREYRLRFTKQDFAPKLLNNAAPPASLQVEMQAGAFIAGTVSNSEGEPIDGANIECYFHSEPNQDFYTYATSDNTGEFSIKCQPESQHNRITISAPGYTSKQYTLVKSGVSGLQITLDTSSNLTIRGRLVTPQQAAITHASLRAYTSDGKYLKVIESFGPNQAGVFWLQVAVTTGEVRATTSTGAVGKRAFGGEAGGIVDLGDVEIDAGYSLTGIVHEEGAPEKPVKDCKLTIGSTTVYSAADGSYHFDGLGSNEFTVRLLHPAYLGSAKKFTPTSGEYKIEYDFELKSANFEARATVVEAATQKGLEGVSVDVIDYGQTMLTNTEGSIHITGLSAMTISIKLSKAGYVPRTVSISADISEKVKNAPPTVIEMQPGSPLTGVCTQGGKPLPGAVEVEIWSNTGLATTVETDSSGKYSTDNLPPNTYFVRIPEYHAAGKRIVVPVEGGAVCNIQLTGVSHMRGKVFKSNGQAHANQGIYVYTVPDGYYVGTVIIDPEGNYEIKNLWVSEFSFNILKSPGDSSSQFAMRVNITKTGWVNHDIHLPQATGVIEGKVTYPDGSPVKKARVSITNLDAAYPRALLAAYVVTDDEGNYRAERLENGVQMIVRVGGYPDEATTGIGFSETINVASNNAVVRADFQVAESGVRIKGTVTRSDGGPLGGHFLLTMVDSEGRLAGLFFGNGSAQKITFWVYDAIPGTYTLQLTDRWMKQQNVQITIGENDVLDFTATMEPSDRR